MAVEVGVARETAPGERRVALTPETCKKLVKAGAQVRIERGAGASRADSPMPTYAEAGARVVDDAPRRARRRRYRVVRAIARRGAACAD